MEELSQSQGTKSSVDAPSGNYQSRDLRKACSANNSFLSYLLIDLCS